MAEPKFVPLTTFCEYPTHEMVDRAHNFYLDMKRRRTVRHFSDRAVPRQVIEDCLLTAGTAPNGANLQPWYFVVVSNPETKRQIRIAAEAEEHEFYTNRAPEEWKEALLPYGTNE